MKPDELINKTRSHVITIGNLVIPSQNPNVITEGDRVFSARFILPAFIALWLDIERATGYRWKATSYIRDSPSHKLGQAFDLAPDIAESAASLYAVTNHSDPVLYKRAPLIRALQTLKNNVYGKFHIGAFLEPDHIHLQTVPEFSGNTTPFFVAKWKIPKPIYPDTYERMRLPIIE